MTCSGNSASDAHTGLFKPVSSRCQARAETSQGHGEAEGAHQGYCSRVIRCPHNTAITRSRANGPASGMRISNRTGCCSTRSTVTCCAWSAPARTPICSTNSGHTLTMRAMPEPRSVTVTHAALLDALRRVRQRQVVRYRHGRVLDALHALGVIEWVRQPERRSQQLSSPDSAFYRAPIEVAQFTPARRTALGRLACLEATPGSPRLGGAPRRAVCRRMAEQASKLAAAVPLAQHRVGLWFRPLSGKRLAGEGMATLGALVAFCIRRGGSWWRSVPRIGLLRARVLVAWLRRHAGTLEMTIEADVDAADPLVATAATHVMLEGEGQGGVLPPLDAMEWPDRRLGH